MPARPEPYSFSHVLTREAAYRALLERNRQQLHSLTADALASRLQPGSSGQWVILPALATHLVAAGRHTEAHRCWCDLLRLAGRCGVLERAGEWEAAALASLQASHTGGAAAPATSAALELARAAGTHRVIGQHAARDAYALAVELAQREGDRLTESRALRLLGALNNLLSDSPAGQAQLQQSLVLARELGDRSGEAAALAELGNHAVARHGEYAEGLGLFQAGIAAAQAAGDWLTESSILGNLASLYHEHLGLPQAADECFRRCLAAQRALGNRAGEAIACENCGSFCLSHGELAEATILLHAAISLYQEVGDRPGIGSALAKLGQAQLLAGDAAAAAASLNRSHAILRELPGEELWLANTECGLGDVALTTLDYSAAGDWFARALATNQVAKSANCDCIAHHGLAQIALAENELPTTRQELAAAALALDRLGRSDAEANQELLAGRLALAEAAYAPGEERTARLQAGSDSLRRAEGLADEFGLAAHHPVRAGVLAARVSAADIAP